MRILTIASLLALATACTGSWSDDYFDYGDELGSGVVYTSSRGVAINDAGTDAQIGMYGTTCVADAQTGAVGDDYDFPSSAESVTDAGQIAGSDAVAVVSSEGAHVIVEPGSWTESTVADFPVDAAVDAQIVPDGLVILAEDFDEGCQVTWTGSHASEDLDPAFCSGLNTLAVDPDTGRAIVGNEFGVVSVTPGEGATPLADSGDLIAQDRYAGLTYIAQTGESWVMGVEADGSVRWEVDLSGSVLSLSDLGWRESAVALVNTDGSSEVVRIDAETGDMSLLEELPLGAREVVTSDDGRTFAVIRPNEVRFGEFDF